MLNTGPNLDGPNSDWPNYVTEAGLSWLDAKRRECDWKKSSEERESSMGEIKGGAIGKLLMSREGRVGSAIPLHAWRESVTDTSQSFQK